ncbi:MAG: TIGR00269 family protein, partial [Candidatus Hadarchaeales archaeon]
RGDLARLYRLGPAYAPLEGFVPRIKPLRNIPEKEIALYAFLKGIEVDLSACPHRGEIHSEIRDFLNQLEENHPNSKFMIVRMFDKMKPHLEKTVPEFIPRECEVCGEPTSGGICKGCELLRALKN